MPAMSKLGCNAGTCHGAAKGQERFQTVAARLRSDVRPSALTDDLAGRRFNRAAPEQSLMLLKPTGAVPHVGGVLIKPGEPYYELLRSWIAEGVKLDLDSPRVKSLDILPKNPLVPLPGMKQQMAVLATYTDGKVRDVTPRPSSKAAAPKLPPWTSTVWSRRCAAARRPMMARYEGAYAATTLVVMGDRTGFAWKPVPEHNYIDSSSTRSCRQVKVLPSDLCSDSDFMRRIYLDLTGLPPRIDDSAQVPGGQRPTRVKRDELIDRLIGSPDYVENWTNKWADLLQVNRKFLGEEGPGPSATGSRRPWPATCPTTSSFTRAHGQRFEPRQPAGRLLQGAAQPPDAMENTTQLFLAVRFNCNKCHDHPFERWTQDQYYQTGGLLRPDRPQEDPEYRGPQDRRHGRRWQPLPLVRRSFTTQERAKSTHIRTGQATPPIFPYHAHESAAGNGAPPRAACPLDHLEGEPVFRQELRQPHLELPARRWHHRAGGRHPRRQSGRAIPKLLDTLTDEFIASGFNVRELIRAICKSRDLPALHRDQQVECRRRRSTTRTRWPGGCRRRCSTTPSTGPPARSRGCRGRGRCGCSIPTTSSFPPTASSSRRSANRRARVPANANAPAA